MAKFQGLQQAAQAAQSQGGGNGGSKMARFGQQMRDNPQQAGFLANALGRAASQAGQGQPSTQVQGQSVGGRGPMGMLQARMQDAQSQARNQMAAQLPDKGMGRQPYSPPSGPAQRNQRYSQMLRAGRGGGRFGRG